MRFLSNRCSEVLDAPETLAALPASEELVLGVTPFRNTLLPLLSLRGLLGFPQGARNEREKVVVARVGGALVGLLADRMRTIFPADAGLIEKIPPVLAARAGGEAEDHRDLPRRRRAPAGFRSCRRSSCSGRTSCSGLKAGGGSTPEGEKDTGRQAGARSGSSWSSAWATDEFGLPIEAVNEVARVPDQITRLPKTPKFLEGVVNLRGDVLPVVDQRRRFDMPALEEQGGAPPRRGPHRAPPRRPDRRFGVGGAAMPGERDRAGARSDQRDRFASSRA